jgi:hypothetical protein
MPRITVNINQKLNSKLLKISKEHNESLSQIIKQFILKKQLRISATLRFGRILY